jgi:hypothetical protein
MTESNDYLGSLDPDELQAEQEFFENHWANDLLDAPHALIAVIETKIARAVIAERERIIKILENHRISIKDISVENWIGLWHDAIAKVKEDQK